MVPFENFSSGHNAGHQSVSGTEKLLKFSLSHIHYVSRKKKKKTLSHQQS